MAGTEVMREASMMPDEEAISPVMVKMMILVRTTLTSWPGVPPPRCPHGQGIAAEGGLVEQQAEQHEADGGQPDGRRDAEQGGVAELEEALPPRCPPPCRRR